MLRCGCGGVGEGMGVGVGGCVWVRVQVQVWVFLCMHSCRLLLLGGACVCMRVAVSFTPRLDPGPVL